MPRRGDEESDHFLQAGIESGELLLGFGVESRQGGGDGRDRLLGDGTRFGKTSGYWRADGLSFTIKAS